MKEQGHDLPEIITRVEEMTLRADWTQPGLSPKDLHTINDVFNRPNKYEFRPKDMDAAKPLASGSIEGITLIDEMFTYVRDKDRMLGTSTGIEGLDKMLGGGIRKGELNVLAASGKTGKSSLFHYLIYNLLMAGHRVSYASRELTPATEVLPNLLSIDTGQNIYKLEPEQINESYVDLVKGIVGRWPLSFAEGYGVFSIEEIENWVRTEKDKGTEFFFADHLHHFVMTEDHQEVAKVIKHIKTLTKKYDICMNLIVQPRTLREGEKVNLNTIRGGAVIHQTLDNLFVFERMKNQTDISKLILESARHKLCRPGEIYLKYDQDSMRFEEVVKELVQPGEMEQEYGSYTKQRHKWQGHRI
jgi:KaiC/GvpD/RAD55 family RecA-like ATPase